MAVCILVKILINGHKYNHILLWAQVVRVVLVQVVHVQVVHVQAVDVQEVPLEDEGHRLEGRQPHQEEEEVVF
jgi:hypothetical protein